MRQRILFVDDEPQLLSGLRRMLWDKREVWDMHFAAGGVEALALLEEMSMDVVVSDARMPGMDGPEFLETVRRRWPGTARLILSGHSDREFMLRSARPAHQFLSKPCPPEVLKGAIARVLRLSVLFADERLRPAIAHIDTLPVLSGVFEELTEALRSPNASVGAMGAIIARDVGLATGILKLVNSAFFGLPARVSSIAQAVTLLGVETLRALVLSQALFSRFDARRYPRFSLERLWRHSLGVARCARALAAIEGADKAVKDICFMAGMVHDMGKLVLAELFPDEYARVLRTVEADNVAIDTAERAVFGVSHAAVGGYLLGLWGFDEGVVLAVARHHQPTRGASPVDLALTMLHAANAFEHELVVIHPHYAPHPLDLAMLAAQGLDGREPGWREVCRNLLAQGGEGGDGE